MSFNEKQAVGGWEVGCNAHNPSMEAGQRGVPSRADPVAGTAFDHVQCCGPDYASTSEGAEQEVCAHHEPGDMVTVEN
jgi:hypothetical protein